MTKRFNLKRVMGQSAMLLTLTALPTLGWAGCYINSGLNPQRIDMNVGRVIVPADAQIGDVLAEKSFPIYRTNEIGGCYGSGYLYGEILQGQQSQFSDVYTTSIQGIGLRLAREIGDLGLITYYPHNLRRDTSRLYLGSGQFTVEVIKTGQQTGSGPIAPGQYTTYYAGDTGRARPILTSYLSANAITVISPTCNIEAGSRNIPVNFGQISTTEFAGIGTTNRERNFEIGMQCSGPNVGQAYLDLGFDYTPDNNAPAGVIEIDGGSEAASGVGIQLINRNDNSPVENGESVRVGTLAPGSYRMTLPMMARYYQTAQIVEPGQVNATAEFTIEYQ